jgi:hypothetical protein
MQMTVKTKMQFDFDWTEMYGNGNEKENAL